MLATRYKHLFNRLLQPLAAWIARSGIPASVVTLCAPLLGLVVCVVFVRMRAVLPFCVAMAVVACLDGLDGAVARASGHVTKRGAYLDAMGDRYVETMALIAAASVTGYWFLSSLVLAGSLLVSYAKARAAMEVAVSNAEWPDLMERPERLTVFLVGLAASAVSPWRPFGRDLFWWALLVLAVLVHLTVAQRLARACRLIDARAGR